jgi:hypothetical protein
MSIETPQNRKIRFPTNLLSPQARPTRLTPRSKDLLRQRRPDLDHRKSSERCEKRFFAFADEYLSAEEGEGKEGEGEGGEEEGVGERGGRGSDNDKYRSDIDGWDDAESFKSISDTESAASDSSAEFFDCEYVAEPTPSIDYPDGRRGGGRRRTASSEPSSNSSRARSSGISMDDYKRYWSEMNE